MPFTGQKSDSITPATKLFLPGQKRINIIFTHDLDFGNLLAATAGNAPSVIQVRTQNVFPDALGSLVVKAIRQFQEELMGGALISIDEQRARAHILPFHR